ncbi:hypothetical protein Acr_01g0013690 [Actinidia rufa]|uniref:Uncharacterized protein n=1 Tax=Actinidia rufa TaxID=165716 RepID=A0A7J0E572_9ERIC|nr:hypothetical protein Acr_01g0013690 [Actinidia rufa]
MTTRHHHHHTDFYMEAQHTPPCVVSYQISSPPSLDLSLATSHDSTNDADSETDQKQSDSLWLSQLKSMARQEGEFDHAASIVIGFRASRNRLSLSPSPLKKQKHFQNNLALSLQRIKLVVDWMKREESIGETRSREKRICTEVGRQSGPGSNKGLPPQPIGGPSNVSIQIDSHPGLERWTPLPYLGFGNHPAAPEA